MNKKILIGVVIAIVAILSVTGFIVFKNINNGSNSSKFDESDLIDVDLSEEDNNYVETYWNFIKNSDDSIFKNDFIYKVADVDFNKIPDLVIYNGKNIKSLTIVDDKVEMHDIEYETNSLEFDLQYSENENRYYYTIGDKDKEFAFITIDNIEKKENLSIPKEDNISESISDDELIELTKEKFNSYEAYQKNYILTEFKSYEKVLAKYDFNKTYELASANSSNNNDSNSEQSKNSTLLRDVAKVGDYVNYMGSDTDWRIIYISDDSFEKKEVHLVYSSYIVDDWEPTNNSYEQVLDYLKSTSNYNKYLDPKYADQVYTSVPTRDFEFRLSENYKNVPDLYDVGADINLAGETNPNSLNSISLAFYKNGSGKVTATGGWEHNIRPTVYLKENITTTGKNSNGAWILDTPNEPEVTYTDFIENQIVDNFDKTYLGDYQWEKGNDRMAFELQEETDGSITYYLMYYPKGYTSPSEQMWGKWDTKDININNVKNDNEYALATYSFSNIKYNNDLTIEITIKTESIISTNYQEDKIPDGTYLFKKK